MLWSFFCGHGAVNRHIEAWFDQPCLGFDILNGCEQDFNGGLGFATALQWWRLLQLYGWEWLGTLCSTCIFLSRHSTGRSKSCPRGNLRLSCVREGNQHVARSALMMALAYSQGQGFIIEQPASPMMFQTKPMMWVRDQAARMGMLFEIIETYMSAFKASGHLKPTVLATNRKSIKAMARVRPALTKSCSVVKKSKRSDGKVACTGNKYALKATQQYPEEFGAAIAQAISKDCFTKLMMPAPVPTVNMLDFFHDGFEELDEDWPWLDLDLEGALAFALQHHADQ